MTMKENMTFSVFPIGTRLYRMIEGKLIELEINSIRVCIDANDGNYILYEMYTSAGVGVYRFVQPLDGKFKKATSINGNKHINTLYETKEKCIKAFLKELGVRTEVKLTID